jgi:hypothetical protein
MVSSSLNGEIPGPCRPPVDKISDQRKGLSVNVTIENLARARSSSGWKSNPKRWTKRWTR